MNKTLIIIISIVLGIALFIGLGWFIAWQSMKIDALEQQIANMKITTQAKVKIDARIREIDSHTDVYDRADEYNKLWQDTKGSCEMPGASRSDQP